MKELTLKSLLREVAAHKGFRYVEVRRDAMAEAVLEVAIEPRKGSRGCCGQCGRPGATYDHQSESGSDRQLPDAADSIRSRKSPAACATTVPFS